MYNIFTVMTIYNYKTISFMILFLLIQHINAQNWNQILKASAGDRSVQTSTLRQAEDRFGYAVSVDGNFAVVGIPFEDEDSSELNTISDAGSAAILYFNGTEWTQIQKITAGNRNTSDNFGYSVSISGDCILVGAPYEDEDTIDGHTVNSSGSAYIFKRGIGGTNTWGMLRKITAPFRAATDFFGFSVAIHGDYAIVGAYNEDENSNESASLTNSGSAYIFKKNNGGTDHWGFLKKITANDRGNYDLFGYAVSISDNHVIIGAFHESHDVNGSSNLVNSGSAYIFNRDQGGTDQWGQVKKITASTRAAGDYFGASVSICGDYVVVGAYGEDENSNETNTLSASGSAYIFSKNNGGTNNWGQVKKITASLRAASDNFGVAVAMDGDYIVVTASQEDENSNETNTLTASGSAYIFKKDQGGNNNWGQVKKITASLRGASDLFGIAVAMSSDFVLVGASSEDEDHNEINTLSSSGSAYMFKKDQGGSDNWGQIKKCVYMGFNQNDHFGKSVAMDGLYAIVGALNDDASDSFISNSGSAYILKNVNGKWVQIKKIVAPAKAVNDNFGFSVSINGDYAMVGAPYEDEDSSEGKTLTNSGSAYIFKKDKGGTDNWGLIKKITSNYREANDNFGFSVDIHGNYAIVGAYLEDQDSCGCNFLSGSGSAYIFKKDKGGTDNWGQVKKINAAIRGTDDYFGYSVSIYNDYALVGAVHEDQDANDANFLNSSGSAYLFKKDQGGTDNWGQIKKITAGTRAASDQFGQSVCIGNNYAIIGAPYESHDAHENNFIPSSGSAYIFHKNQGGTDQWGQIKKITATQRNNLDYYGECVDITDSFAIVGARGDDEDLYESNNKSSSGSAYIYKINQGGTNNWGLVNKITAEIRTANDEFGNAVAISGNFAIVGSKLDDEDAHENNFIADAGSAYIFYNGCYCEANLPTIANTTYTGSFSTTDTAGWTHYCNSDGKLLLSLKIGSSGAVVPADSVTLKLGSSTTFSSTGTGGMINHSDGYSIIDRRWNVNPTTQPNNGNVGVKYYFTNEEFSSLQTALSNLPFPSTLNGVNEMNMYKSTSGNAFANPHTVNGIILSHGYTPSTQFWVSGTQGNGNHAAEFQVTSFSGGGGGGGGGGGAGPSPLPLQLISFTVVAQETDAFIQWQTAMESDISHYELERMLNSNPWQVITHIPASNNPGLSVYSFQDLFILKNLNGQSVHYRLKTISYNGSEEYSQLVTLTSIQKENIKIWQNEQEIFLLTSDTYHHELAIFDMNGKKVYENKAGPNQMFSFHLTPGCYVLRSGDHTQKVLVR